MKISKEAVELVIVRRDAKISLWVCWRKELGIVKQCHVQEG